MGLPIESDVRRIFSRIIPILLTIGRGAWQDWLTSSEAGRTRFSRTRAAVVWERMIDRAITAFDAIPGIRHIEKFQTVSFIIDDYVLFRFKKADSNYLSRNIQTKLALAFHDPNARFPYFENMDFIRVEVVYILNKLETELQGIYVVARQGRKTLWHYDIGVPEATAKEFPESVRRTPAEDLVQPPLKEEKISGRKE